MFTQPPSGGCVLKRLLVAVTVWLCSQPPSGGCVLKLQNLNGIGEVTASRLRAAVC